MLADAHISSLGYLWYCIDTHHGGLVTWLQTKNIQLVKSRLKHNSKGFFLKRLNLVKFLLDGEKEK